ncbi:S-adenosyl-L-methionine-dependent methyltransferase [Xylariaceae sp. FL0662B]|nr:S-adenosyl-L-methionine-dependent methyltransferase [Xylariaceae sp. FL0662B]
MDIPLPPLLKRTAAALRGLLDPWVFLATASTYLPGTIYLLARAGRFADLLSPCRLRGVWFGRFWDGIKGPGPPRAAPLVSALLAGRTRRGAVVDEPVRAGVCGTVLETGAGGGQWVDVFAEHHRRGGVRRVVAVEPSADQRARLRAAVDRAGLGGVYAVVPGGVEDLGRFSCVGGGGAAVEKGSVDCIVSVLCLCSIPDPERNIRELYGYLRKGGRWFVYEHVRCEYSWYMRMYQRFINLFWPYFIGGCLLCRQTEKTLREAAGPWEDIDVGQPPTEPWYQCLPHVLGVFTK